MEKVDEPSAVDVTISVVSHAQIELIKSLLDDINRYCRASRLELILTLNVDELLPFSLDDYFFSIKVIKNSNPLGFGANHNQAFKHASGQYFCVINPDIRLSSNPFQQLMSCFYDASFGVVAPVVRGLDGGMEDSARRFPSPLKILCKVFGKCRGSDYLVAEIPIFPDWVGGMCMVFPSGVFKKIGGFDQRYFLYYEDVDLCGRLMLSGYKSVVCPQATVVHHAQRSSHRNLKYLRWHLASMMRFFLSSVYWRLQWHKVTGRA
jgi:N-acetylglucosaminyl-diphospho-decaprenol L-rhamnosyltransferase